MRRDLLTYSSDICGISETRVGSIRGCSGVKVVRFGITQQGEGREEEKIRLGSMEWGSCQMAYY
jgi:hypothetical protein